MPNFIEQRVTVFEAVEVEYCSPTTPSQVNQILSVHYLPFSPRQATHMMGQLQNRQALKLVGSHKWKQAVHSITAR